MSLHTAPRLYIDIPLCANTQIALPDAQAHYIRNVMRKKEGAPIRAFNTRDGEFETTLAFIGKRDIALNITQQIRAPQNNARRIHLITPVLKKDRMDILVEKSVELGVTDIHPAIFERSDIRDIKSERLTAQIIEAAEQSERLSIPDLHPIQKLQNLNFSCPIFAALERSEAKPFDNTQGDLAILIGPAGGFTDNEREWLNDSPNITPVTLGENILRAETAAIAMLARLI